MTAEEPDYYPYNFHRFARQLAAKHTVLQSVLDAHVEDHGEILFTSYMCDAARKFIELYLNPNMRATALSILPVLEEAMATDDPALANEVAVGFVEMLPCADEAGVEAIRAILPARLREHYDEWFGAESAP